MYRETRGLVVWGRSERARKRRWSLFLVATDRNSVNNASFAKMWILLARLCDPGTYWLSRGHLGFEDAPKVMDNNVEVES